MGFPVRILVAAAMLAWLPSHACAQPYPSGPIRIVVGFGPASTADTMARLVGKHLEQRFNQPVIIENRPGNSSMIAAETVAKAPKDGQTLFMATVANTLNPAQTNSGFDLAKAMAPIALLGVVPNLLCAYPEVPADNVAQLVALAKAKPETLTFGDSGIGTASHLAAEMFNMRAGTSIVSVHYQSGSNQVLTDLLTGRITMSFNVAATMAPHVAAGKLKALAVAQPHRASLLPDVPTLDEAGMPGIDAGIWIGLLAPADTPAEIVETLSRAANDALKSNAVATPLRTAGIDVLGGTPQEFAVFIRADMDKWATVLSAVAAKK